MFLATYLHDNPRTGLYALSRSENWTIVHDTSPQEVINRISIFYFAGIQAIFLEGQTQGCWRRQTVEKETHMTELTNQSLIGFIIGLLQGNNTLSSKATQRLVIRQ